MCRRTRAAFLPLIGLALGFTGCSGTGPSPFEEPPVRVVCTTTIVADMVQQVGGDRVAVQTLMGAGVDPHKYLPTPSDRAKLETAHLVFFSGLHLEGKMADLFERSSGRIRGFALTRDIPKDRLRPAEPGTEVQFDPHVWFDVPLWAITADCVRYELTKLDPAGADLYARNTEDYRKELAALDAEIRVTLDRVPKEKRVLVTSHDAFGYFGRAYGFEVVGLQGVSTASETATRDVQDLAKLLGMKRIPAVFTETSVPPDGLKKVLETTRAGWKHEVALIGGDEALYSDALGEPQSPGGTYPGMIRHNARVIVNALGQ